jgi:hypothetical protein
MMKKIYLSTACAALVLGHGLAKEPELPDVAGWMDSALAGKRLSVPEEAAPLERNEVQAQKKLLWQAYKDAAMKAGWDKELLGVPTSIEKMIKKGGRLEIKGGKLEAGDKTMPYALMAKGEKPANGWPLFISMHGGGKYHGKDKIEAHGWDVNSREWQAQMNLTAGVYKPTGLYFLPHRMTGWDAGGTSTTSKFSRA